jgi:hypothetical protein
MLLPIAEKIIDQLKQALEVKSEWTTGKILVLSASGGGVPSPSSRVKNKRFLFLNVILIPNCLNPVHRQGDCPPILFHLACE